MIHSSDDFFATTRWTLIRAAGQEPSPMAREALESLCGTYWFPLYAYIRRCGFSKEDAEDLTQAFFAKLLERRDFDGLAKENGRFRAFLLASLKHFLSNERDHRNRKKRGGTLTHFSLDWQNADAKFEIADSHQPSPDQTFDREWATALLERVLQRLRDESMAGGNGERFEQLKGFLTISKDQISCAEKARVLGIEEGTLRVAVHRLRQRYRELLRHEIRQTLSDPAMVEEELAALMNAFRV
ncbi:MAG: sigma-70 family RNA polymerase sigma factor [Luteolibacter sp.]